MPRYCVEDVSANAAGKLPAIVLEGSLPFTFVFRCRSGRCISLIEGDALVVDFLGSIGVSSRRMLFGSCSSGVLLPPPFSERSGGGGHSVGGRGVYMGMLSDGTPVFLSLDNLWRHVGVFGSTGSGKSHTVAHIVSEASRHGLRSIVLDWHGEYAALLSGLGAQYTVVSGRGLPAVSFVADNVPLETSVEILKANLSLSSFQATILHIALGLVGGLPLDYVKKVLLSAHSGPSPMDPMADAVDSLSSIARLLREDNSVSALLATITRLWSILEQNDALADFYRFSRYEREVWAALFRRLQSLAISRYSWLFRIRGSSFYDQLRLYLDNSPIVVLDLSSIANPWIRRLYTSLAISMMYDEAIRRGELNLLVAVEEAHNIYTEETYMLNHVLAEARKYRLGFIVVAHSPSLLPQLVLANINTLIVHRMTSPRDIQVMKNVLVAPDAEKVIPRLAPGEALFQSPDALEALVIRVPFRPERRLENPADTAIKPANGG